LPTSSEKDLPGSSNKCVRITSLTLPLQQHRGLSGAATRRNSCSAALFTPGSCSQSYWSSTTAVGSPPPAVIAAFGRDTACNSRGSLRPPFCDLCSTFQAECVRSSTSRLASAATRSARRFVSPTITAQARSPDLRATEESSLGFRWTLANPA
jgi:hypothetical protein